MKLRQQRCYNSNKNIICSTLDESLLYQYKTSDHDTYIFEEITHYICLLVQIKEFDIEKLFTMFEYH